MKRKRLGEVLSERGHISPADLAKALREQQGKVIHLGELLLQRKLVSKDQLASALAEISGVEYVDARTLNPPPEVFKTIPASLARRCRAIPVRCEDKTLVVLMSQPQNLQLLDELRFKTGMKIDPRFGFLGEVQTAIDRLYGIQDDTPPAEEMTDDLAGLEFISSSSQERNVRALREMQQELQQKSKTTPAVHLVATMIKAAISKRASDIHIEPQQSETTVRMRVDGVLREFRRLLIAWHFRLQRLRIAR